MIEIIKGSDEILKIQASRKPGLFQFSETNFSDITIELFDNDDSSIASYTYSGSTVVPVTVSYASNGNEQYTEDTDTDICLIYLQGTSTTSKATGMIKAKITISWSNTNFTADNTKDTIYIIEETGYYLTADL